MTERQKEIIRMLLQKELEILAWLSLEVLQDPNSIYDIDRIDNVINEIKELQKLI